jgi:hypothetical protein
MVARLRLLAEPAKTLNYGRREASEGGNPMHVLMRGKSNCWSRACIEFAYPDWSTFRKAVADHIYDAVINENASVGSVADGDLRYTVNWQDGTYADYEHLEVNNLVSGFYIFSSDNGDEVITRIVRIYPRGKHFRPQSTKADYRRKLTPKIVDRINNLLGRNEIKSVSFMYDGLVNISLKSSKQIFLDKYESHIEAEHMLVGRDDPIPDLE